MKHALIKLENISINFNDRNILENFSLEILKGEKILITGSSGKGKTTLLKALLGFKQIKMGEIYIKNQLLTEDNISQIRNDITYLPQNIPFRNLNIKSLISEILSYDTNLNISLTDEKITELLQEFSLDSSIILKKFNDLSGGEKQRFAFIIAIILDRDIWIFDEITSSLDQEMKEKIILYIKNTNKTVIIVSHDTVKAFEMFRRIEL
ncbi:ATP-binding cassette domain-containing protein [Cetobacterium sp. 2A]|uniref:ABC transporter ATP-binding protein n=1 Tax=Cetobacterium sp. 2A TaxID=2754723 RepID=UPI00163BD08A|nr:ATP-binding cassette domain-containing protein [Cetobacterium sp. 2A]MBC2857314.1 ATP-binding cassette domain-containing protein [Cetobacterium sp. 2A]